MGAEGFWDEGRGAAFGAVVDDIMQRRADLFETLKAYDAGDGERAGERASDVVVDVYASRYRELIGDLEDAMDKLSILEAEGRTFGLDRLRAELERAAESLQNDDRQALFAMVLDHVMERNADLFEALRATDAGADDACGGGSLPSDADGGGVATARDTACPRCRDRPAS